MKTDIIIGLVCLLAFAGITLGAYMKGREAGKEVMTIRYEKLLADARKEKEHVEANARAISTAKDREYQAATDELRARVDSLLTRPSPGIRLCKPASDDKARIPDATPVPDEAPGGRGPDMRSGEDISGSVLVFASRCESDRQQLIALQGWVNAQAASWNGE